MSTITTTAPRTSARQDRMREVQSKLEQHVQELADALASGKSEALTRYLEFASKFHHYSLNNQLLIWCQRPTATMVAGIRRWNQLGRRVIPGEKGLLIYAPMFLRSQSDEQDLGNPQRSGRSSRRSNEDADDSPTENVSDAEADAELRYRAVFVFDVSQTTGDALPQLTRANGDCEGILEAMELAVRANNIQLEYMREIPGHPTAEGVSRGGHIILKRDLLPADMLRVLAHEFAHELLHWSGSKPSASIRECEADGAAFVVMRHFGLWCDSADYIQLHDADVKVFTERLDNIRRTASTIIDQTEKCMGSRDK